MAEFLDVQMTGADQSLDTLRGLSRDLQQKGVRSALHIAAKPLLLAMKSLAPDDSRTPGNRLADSINKVQAKPGRKVMTGAGHRVVKSEADEVALIVGPNKKVRGKPAGYIAWFMEVGTAPHDIVPKKDKTLKLFIGGNYVTSKTIKHPGIRARKWMAGAMTQSQGQLMGEFYKGLDKWLAKQG
jgi:HK97 gp10 family phage protein